MNIIYILTGIILLCVSLEDIRRKYISGVGPIVILVLGIVGLAIRKNYMFVLLGIVPGVISFILSYSTRQKLGYGDSLVISTLGLVLGMNSLLLVLMIGSLMACIVGLMILLIKRKGKDYEMAFVPYIFLGYIWVML